MIPTSTLHLFDQLMGPACLVDDAGVILAANPAFAELVERPSAVGLLLSDLLAREPGAVDRCLEAWLRQPELWPCPFETAPARRQVIAHGALIDPEARLVLVRLALKETDRFGLRDSRLQSVGEEAGLRRASQEAAHLRAVLSAAPDALMSRRE